jgi:hypothetical protein
MRTDLRFFIAGYLIVTLHTFGTAQTIESLGGDKTAVEVSPCDLMERGGEFAGRIVSIRGVIASGFETFGLRLSCKGVDEIVWLDVADRDLKSKSTDIVEWAPLPDREAFFRKDRSDFEWQPYKPPVPVSLREDKGWHDFLKCVNAEYEPKRKGQHCLSCPLYSVIATLIGRFDYMDRPMVIRTRDGVETYVKGFGHLNFYDRRLVLCAVKDVLAERIKYQEP